MRNRPIVRPLSLARPLLLGVPVVSIAALLSAGLTTAEAAPSAATGWRVIRAFGPANTDLTSIVAFRHGASHWLGGQALSPKLQFYVAVESLAPMPQPLTALTTQLGTGVNGQVRAVGAGELSRLWCRSHPLLAQ